MRRDLIIYIICFANNLVTIFGNDNKAVIIFATFVAVLTVIAGYVRWEVGKEW